MMFITSVGGKAMIVYKDLELHLGLTADGDMAASARLGYHSNCRNGSYQAVLTLMIARGNFQVTASARVRHVQLI